MGPVGFIFLAVVFQTLFIGTECVTCCPDDWVAYRGSCYLFGHGKKSNFVTAENYCRQHGAHLIYPDSVRENEFIKSYLSELKEVQHWMGISDEKAEGIWQLYGRDTDLTFTDWAPGQPASDAGDEDCAAYNTDQVDHKWFDAECSDIYEPLCEKDGTGESMIIG